MKSQGDVKPDADGIHFQKIDIFMTIVIIFSVAFLPNFRLG